MTKRNRIAWTYLVAVPVVLIIVLVQNGALVQAIGHQTRLVEAASAMEDCDTISASLEQLELAAGRYKATGIAGYDERFRAGVSQLRAILQRLQESTKDDSTRLQAQLLAGLVNSETDAWQQGMDSKKIGQLPARTGAELPNQQLSADISKALADIKHGQQTRMQSEKDAAMQSLRLTSHLIKYSGGFVLWIVMIAAFLLFHDEKARDWVGVERRAHTRILAALPLSVCLSTESGVILYVNQVAQDVFGYRPGELLGRDTIAREGRGERSREIARHIFDRLTPGEVWSGRLPIHKADGACVEAASWIKNLEVGEKHCQLLIHSTLEVEPVGDPDEVEKAHV